MKMKKTKKKKNNRLWLVVSVGLSMAFFLLMLDEVETCKDRYLSQYTRTMESYLETLIENGRYVAKQSEMGLTDGVITAIEEQFPTSSKCFCFVGKENEILFFRDREKTEEVSKVTLETYLGESVSGIRRMFRVGTTRNEFRDGECYWVSRLDLEEESGIVTVGICTQEQYLLTTGNFNLLQRHLLLYVGLFGVAYVICTIFLLSEIKERDEIAEALKVQLSNEIVTVERLSQKLESREHSDIMGGEGCFYSRSIVERMLSELTKEQRKRCRKILVYLNTSEQAVAVRFAVLMERMLKGVAVFCLWDDNEYQIVVLNMEDEAVENLAKQLVIQYRKVFQKEIGAVRIVVDRL